MELDRPLDFEELKIDPIKKKKRKKAVLSIEAEKAAELLSQREIKLVSVDDIHPNPWNKNSMAADYYKALKMNLSNPAVGFTIPILVREHPDGDGFQILDGYHRHKAASEVGYKEIPCVVIPAMSDSLAKYITVESNQIHGTTKDIDLKLLMKEIEISAADWVDENFDIYKAALVEEPIEDGSFYAMSDDDIGVNKEQTEPITLYFSPSQSERFRKVTSQLRLAAGITLEAATDDIVKHFIESTGFGEIPKED